MGAEGSQIETKDNFAFSSQIAQYYEAPALGYSSTYSPHQWVRTAMAIMSSPRSHRLLPGMMVPLCHSHMKTKH